MRRLELSLNILESYCNEVKSEGGSKESLDRIEKQIAAFRKRATAKFTNKVINLPTVCHAGGQSADSLPRGWSICRQSATWVVNLPTICHVGGQSADPV